MCPQAVSCLVPEPKHSPYSVSFSSRDVACGDRQQKGKLSLIWHVDSCSSGAKGGPSAHCVWHEVGACIPHQPVLDSSLALHVEVPLPLQGLSWETGDFHCTPLCWVSLSSGQKSPQSSAPGTFLIIPTFSASLRLVPVLHRWVCHCRAAQEHLRLRFPKTLLGRKQEEEPQNLSLEEMGQEELPARGFVAEFPSKVLGLV